MRHESGQFSKSDYHRVLWVWLPWEPRTYVSSSTCQPRFAAFPSLRCSCSSGSSSFSSSGKVDTLVGHPFWVRATFLRRSRSPSPPPRQCRDRELFLLSLLYIREISFAPQRSGTSNAIRREAVNEIPHFLLFLLLGANSTIPSIL